MLRRPMLSGNCTILCTECDIYKRVTARQVPIRVVTSTHALLSTIQGILGFFFDFGPRVKTSVL